MRAFGNQSSTEGKRYKDAVAVEWLERGDVGEMLAKEKDILYCSADRLETTRKKPL